jgi:DNA-directed RNA polymerase subunit RPC12/RpoP
MNKWISAGLAFLTSKLGFEGVECPTCGEKKLKCIEYFRTNPPPDLRYHRCTECGAEFAQEGDSLLQPRNESIYKDDPFWTRPGSNQVEHSTR